MQYMNDEETGRYEKLLTELRTCIEETLLECWERDPDGTFYPEDLFYELRCLSKAVFDESQTVWGSLELRDPRDEDGYYYNLGKGALERGKIKEALEAFKKSLELRNHFKTLAQMSVCYDRLGLPDLAFRHLELAYKANPRNDKTAYDFAEKLRADNRIAEAKEVLEDLLSRNSSYKKARILLQTLP